MSRQQLAGIRVLVVEDDYYLAADARAALVAAGAEVAGPFASEEHALAAVEREAIGCAILDINLGAGPSFGIAQALRSRGIPLVFATGYGRDAIPAEFADVERVEKPCRDRDLLGAIHRLMGVGSGPRLGS